MMQSPLLIVTMITVSAIIGMFSRALAESSSHQHHLPHRSPTRGQRGKQPDDNHHHHHRLPSKEECSAFEACDIDCDALSECYWPGFNHWYLGDGFCDTSGCYNHKVCGFDGGDCCETTCVDGSVYECGDNGFDCKLVSKGARLEEPLQVEEPPVDCSLLTSCNWPGIDTEKLGDGFCDMSSCYNSRECGFDGGDCCEATCPPEVTLEGNSFPVSSLQIHMECVSLLLAIFDYSDLAPLPNSVAKNDYDCQLESVTARCPNKFLRITTFCVNGEPEDNNEDVEVQVALGSDRSYYPDQDNPTCDTNRIDGESGPGTFCVVPYNSCMFMGSSKQVPFSADSGSFSLIVGLAEDDNPATEFEFGLAAPEQWYSDDCRPYEVRIFRTFQTQRTVTSCYTVTTNIGVNLKGFEAGGNSSFERCSSFTEPPQTYIWFLEVRPDNGS